MTRRRAVHALLLATVVGLDGRVDAAAIPDLDAFRAGLGRAESLAARTQRVGAVMMRMQNDLTTQIYTRTLACDPATSSLIARERHLGHVYRDLLQAWRVEVGRLETERQLPIVAPLVVPKDQARLETLLVDLGDEIALWRTTSAWQRARVEPWVGACAAALAPAEGLPPWGPEGAGGGPIVVIGTGAGTLCPAGVPADGAVIMVDGKACVSPPARRRTGPVCTCTPRPVLDGAVLGDAP